MESMREVDRVMEREIAKGSCPLKLDRIEIGEDAYQEITSQEKLYEVLSYLLRVGDYKQYAGRTVNKNVYMDIKGREPVFHRTKSAIERNTILKTIKRYEKKLKPDYDRKVYLETAKCFFTIPEKDMVKYKYIHEGKETYAFAMSDKYIMGLYTHCLLERKELMDEKKCEDSCYKVETSTLDLKMVNKVIFQALILDNAFVQMENVAVNLCSVYLQHFTTL